MIAQTPTISTFWMAIGAFVVLAACWPQAVPAGTNSTATVIAHQLSLRVDRPRERWQLSIQQGVERIRVVGYFETGPS